MKQILLIRHATTDLAGKLCGHIDPPLNSIGHSQAADLASKLRDFNTNRIYSSDLLRSIQTAEQFATPRGLAVLRWPDLREISFGAWEGFRWADIQAQSSFAMPAFESSFEHAPGGERFDHFCLRVTAALKEIANDQHSSEQVIVVTHLGVIRVALTMLARLDTALDTLRLADYCSAYCFAVTGGIWQFLGRL